MKLKPETQTAVQGMPASKDFLWAVHYTTNPKFTVRPITIQNGGFNKPKGGLWVSPKGSKRGWYRWAMAEGFRTEELKRSFRVYLKVSLKHAIIIRRRADLNKLPWIPMFPGPGSWKKCPDFERLVAMGVEVVYLTEKGEYQTHFSAFIGGNGRGLYGWDCECLLILNEKAILEVTRGKPWAVEPK